MAKPSIGICVVMVLAGSSALGGDIAAGVTIGAEGSLSFQLAIREHFGVEEGSIVACRQHKIADEQLPVIFFLAREAKVSPDVILALRLGGSSWMDISIHFSLTAEVFHVEVAKPWGPPYGNAFGHFKNRKRGEWAAIRLADDEIATLVNVKFLSAHFGCTPDAIVEKRAKHGDYIKAGAELKLEKESSKQNDRPAGGENKGASKPPSKPEAKAAGGEKPARGHGGGGGKGRGK